MIRKYVDSDIDAVMQIWLNTNIQAHSFISQDYWKSNFDMVKEMMPLAEIYVHEVDNANQIDGFIGLNNDYIEGIFIKDAAQSKGTGKQLLDQVKKIKSTLKLNVYQKNERAIQFYLRVSVYYFNLVLTLVMLVLLFRDLPVPLYSIFMVAFAIGLIVNFPNAKQQNKKIKEYGTNAMVMTMTLFSVPLLMILGTDAFYYALLPIIIGVVEPFGVAPETVAAAFLLTATFGTPVSPSVAATYVGLGLADVSIGDHIKYSLRLVWPASIAVLIMATVIGVIKF